jgi:3-phenylpropionate/trans-cinnamate dioxygenase ferredoxin reductase component
VGGGLAGASAASSIRKLDPAGRILLISNEHFLPYDRVPLSKAYLMDKIPKERLFLKKAESYQKENLELIRGHELKLVNTGEHTGILDDGGKISYQKLLFATGGSPRKVPIPGSDLKGVFYLRTIEQCDRLKEALSLAHSAVIIGGGFIGCELAAAFATKGLDTTIIEMGPYLLNMALDEETGRWIEQYHTEHGVKVLCNSTALRLVEKDGMVREVEIQDGSNVRADLVVVAVGIKLHTELAERAGIQVDRGIVVNEFLETNFDGVYAAGDIARYYSPIFKKYLRLEHYDIALKHGQIAGENMAGQKKAFDELPYFFSYQFDLKINAYGDLSTRGRIANTENSHEKGIGLLRYYLDNEGTINGALSINSSWDELKKARESIIERKKM